MKKLLIFTTILLLAASAFAVNFTVTLTDDFGDGWNGGLLDVTVAGVLVLDDLTIATGAGPESYTFDVSDADLVELDYVAGGWPYENAYYVYDDNGVLVASSGDAGAEPDAHVEFTAVVGGGGVPGDVCETAIAVGEVIGLPFDTTGATTSGFSTHSINQDLFYVYTPSSDGTVYIDLCDSSFDTKIAVYGECDVATELDYNDDSCGAQSEVFDIPVVAGEDYYIQVGGYGTSFGPGFLDIELTSSFVADPPANLMVTDDGLATWEAPGGGGAEALYSQLGEVSTEGGITAQDFETAYDVYDAEGADEFMVPAGETWTIDQVVALGTGPTGPMLLANIRFYEDNAGMPGTMLFEYLDAVSTPSTDGDLDVAIPPTVFTEGTYWIGIQGDIEYGVYGQWFLNRQVAPTLGYEFYWRNPLDGFGSGFTTWTNGNLQWPGQTAYNLSFGLFGTLTDGDEVIVKSYESNAAPFDRSTIKTIDSNIIAKGPRVTGPKSSSALLSRAFLGYNVYLDGAFSTFTTDLSYQYEGLTNSTTYLAGVTALYDEGESASIDYSFTYVTGVAGDTCGDAMVVAEVTDLPFDTTTATASGFGTYITSQDLFYVYTATADGLLYIGLCDSGFDTKLALYGECDDTTLIDSNDDSCGLQSELIDVPVVAGEDYFIQVGGYSTSAGAGVLDVAFTSSFVADPPANLMVTDDGLATWEAPGGGATSEWLQYDIDVLGFSGIGAEAADYSLIWASKWVPADLTAYSTGYVTKVAVNQYTDPTGVDYVTEVRVMSGDGMTVLYTQDVTGMLTIGWNEIVLDSAVPFDNTENLWIGMYAERPGGTANEPTSSVAEVILDRYDFFAYNGAAWTSINLEYGISDQGWMLRGFVSTSPTGRSVALGHVDMDIRFDKGYYTEYTGSTPTGNGMIAADPNHEYTPFNEISRAFLGYNVYLDGAFSTFTTDLFYQYEGLTNGTEYLSAVTADYDEGESAAIDYTFTYVGADTPAVFFSEYIEGSSNNKAIEVYNNSGAAINLDDFRINQSVNGGGWAFQHIFPAGATLADGDVWVILNDATDPTLFDPANADEILGYPSVVHHNGDDARGLEYTADGGTTWTLIDIIGDPDVDPGDGWDVAGVATATQNHTLVRKDVVTMGNTDWVASAGTNATDSEWIVYDIDTFEYLGYHNDPPSPFDPPTNVAVDGLLGTVTWLAPTAPIIEENIDAYAVGDYIGVVSPHFTTWSNAPGGAEDALVTDVVASSGSNSVVVEMNQDLVVIMDDYTTGIYSYDMKMYVPTGFCGYFNLQKTSTPGQEWAFQAYYQTNGDVVVDAGAAAALTHTFNHDEWLNLKVIVDLDNDWATYYFNGVEMIGYQYSTGCFGTPGLLQFGGANLFGGANSTQPTDVPMYYFDDVSLSELQDFTGFNVYLDGVFDGTVGDDVTEYTYVGLTPETDHIAGVSAVYAGGESDVIEEPFYYNPVVIFLPPNNPAAVVEDYNDVLVTWELPGGETEELLYHSGYDANGIGTGAAADFICAARFTADELATYYGGWDITGVNVLLHSADFSYVGIQVYEGGSVGDPGTLVYEEDITSSALVGEFTNHLLTTPVPLVAGNEYWVGYDIAATGDHPAAVDAGPMVPGKGAWMYFSGAWQTLPELGATLDFNWIINGVVSQSDAIASKGNKRSEVIGRTHSLSRSSSQFEADVAYNSRRESPAQQSSSRSLAGYYVYRDGTEIMDIADPAILSYLDESLDAGTYEYTLEAYYTNPDEISVLTDPVSATVVLNPPSNVEALSQGPAPIVTVTWHVPAVTRGVDSYNVYRDGELREAGIMGLMFLDTPVFTGTYTYNVTAVYEGGWESDLSPDVIVEHVDANGILKPTVTALTGNYPNPFNPTTTISFSLAEASHVSINIYNMRGQLVKTLVNTELENNFHEIVWTGKDNSGKSTASGVYFYKMKASNYTATKKMILMK